MNEQTLEKLAQSLTGDTADIIPFLPYLLQDLWELGSSPEEMLRLIQAYAPPDKGAGVLDLGCGKGAVSIRLAEELACRFKGIDLLPDFIAYAEEKAAEHGVSELCAFEVGDITESVHKERGYDLVIYGAVGNVLGDHLAMLKALSDTVKPGGHILIDDAYLPDAGEGFLLFPGAYPTLAEWRSIISGAGLEFVAIHADSGGRDAGNKRDFLHIKSRAGELSKAYPAKRELFARYVQNQKNEYEDLGSNLIGAVFLLRKGDGAC